MDQWTSDERPDGTPRNDLEKIKAKHEAKRNEIYYGEKDEIDWDPDIQPEQVNLTQVYADEEGKLWFMQRRGEKWKLVRVWHLS